MRLSLFFRLYCLAWIQINSEYGRAKNVAKNANCITHGIVREHAHQAYINRSDCNSFDDVLQIFLFFSFFLTFFASRLFFLFCILSTSS